MSAMTTTAPPTTRQAPVGADRFSFTRTTHLTRWNAVLLGRNRLALVYGPVLPLAALALLLTGDRGDEVIGVSAVGGVLLLAADSRPAARTTSAPGEPQARSA